MKIKPSIKLIEAVLDVKIEKIDYSPVNIIYYSFIDDNNKFLNTNISVFEFVFKVKEWICNQFEGGNLDIGFSIDKTWVIIQKYETRLYSIEAKTESEAIIEAGECVLKDEK